MAIKLSRRAMGTGFLATVASAHASDSPAEAQYARIVVLDWGLAETVVALGIDPVGVAETKGYARRVIAPPLPSGVIDVGLRVAPNLELLQQLNPGLILIPPWMGASESLLARIGETQMLTLTSAGRSPYDSAAAMTMRLARQFGVEGDGRALLRSTETIFQTSKEQVVSVKRPIYVISLVDPFHAAVYGAGSMFDDVLGHLGMRNAWQGKTNDLGMAVVSADQLASSKDAILAYIDPLPSGMQPSFIKGPIWRNLEFASMQRVVGLPPVWLFGGIPSAGRFAHLLANALTSQPPRLF